MISANEEIGKEFKGWKCMENIISKGILRCPIIHITTSIKSDYGIFHGHTHFAIISGEMTLLRK